MTDTDTDSLSTLSIIIPTYNEARAAPLLLRQLAPVRKLGAQIVLVDGGSTDDTVGASADWVDTILTGTRGRATQLQQGTEAARGEAVWFLHADSILAEPVCFARAVVHSLHGGAVWGRFDVALDVAWDRARDVAADAPAGPGLAGGLIHCVAPLMNLRSRWTGIATGDQGIFASRAALREVGGIPQQALMEDIELTRQLKRLGRPACLPGPLVTSARRWQRRGVLSTIVLMWRLRLGYYLGADPAQLAVRYYGAGKP